MVAANAAVARRLLHDEEPLELLWCPETAEEKRVPLLFVHGAHVGAWCWEEHFLPWFASRGFPAYAVSLRGHGASGGRERLNRFGLADYACDLAATVAAIGRAPVLIGHSMGGMVARMEKNMEWMNRVVGSKPLPGEPQLRIEDINAFLARHARKPRE